MLIRAIKGRNKKCLESFITELLQEVKKVKEKGGSEIKIFADRLPLFLSGRYDFRYSNKRRTKKRVEMAWYQIQDKLFCYNIRFTTSSAGTTVLIVKF